MRIMYICFEKNDNILVVKMYIKNKKIHDILNEMLTKYVGNMKIKDKMYLYIKIFVNNLCKKPCVN